MTKRISDADALVAILAWERCQEMADRSHSDILRECWLKDAESAWQQVQQWLSQQ